MIEADTMTFEELAQLPSGVIVWQGNFGLLKGLILRGPSSLCAYIGIPLWHPLRFVHYDDVNLDVHGGLTSAAEGDDEYHPKGSYWFGWDYAHGGDYPFYALEPEIQAIRSQYPDLHLNEHKWIVVEVWAELYDAFHEFTPIFVYGWVEILFRKFLRWLTYSSRKDIAVMFQKAVIIISYKSKSFWLDSINRIRK